MVVRLWNRMKADGDLPGCGNDLVIGSTGLDGFEEFLTPFFRSSQATTAANIVPIAPIVAPMIPKSVIEKIGQQKI